MEWLKEQGSSSPPPTPAAASNLAKEATHKSLGRQRNNAERTIHPFSSGEFFNMYFFNHFAKLHDRFKIFQF
jgi:hypothetical protein